MVYVSNFTQCIDSCDSLPECVAVAKSGSACYRKKKVGTAVANNAVQGARLVTTSTTPSAAAVTTTPAAKHRRALGSFVSH